MTRIFALTDYKGYFGSKWKSVPYRSGFNQQELKSKLREFNIEVEFIRLQDVSFKTSWKNKIVVYTSSEEVGFYYKGYIEDVVLGLERAGAILLPRFDFLRANNNKVYMEILREQLLGEQLSGNSSKWYGTIDELMVDLEQNKIEFPCVIKKASGAMSRGVFLAKNEEEIIRIGCKISRSSNFKSEFKEFIRQRKHSGYQIESKHQHKFIVQKFIAGLQNDWKVLVFGNRYYVLSRGIKQDDFRASGSHYNYKAGSSSGLPMELLNKIKEIYQKLDVPHLSLDFAFDGKKAIIHEFQAVYFGTSTMEFSKDLFCFENDEWKTISADFSQEEEYVWGLVKYLEKHPELL